MPSGLLEDASFNQSPAFGDVDLFSADRPLADAAARAGLDLAGLSACGKDYGCGRDARSRPASPTRTRPSCTSSTARATASISSSSIPPITRMMARSIGHGIHASAHDGSDRPGPMSSRAVRLYLATQAESGHMCPITMTHACIGALALEPALLARWLPKIQSRTYDPRAAAVVGEGRRHAGHGHDRAAGRHRRARQHHPGGRRRGDHVEITGHKWFMSAPMCDAFLVLAQADDRAASPAI